MYTEYAVGDEGVAVFLSADAVVRLYSLCYQKVIMSSGWGIKGKLGRCYPYFSDFKDCLQNRENDTVSVCIPEKLDYLECLHHKKEYVRVKAINEQYKKNLELAKTAESLDHH